MSDRKPKIIYFDLETSALVTRSWTMWEDRPIRLVKDWELLSFAYKQAGGGQSVRFYGRNKHSEEQLVQKLYSLFDSADVLIAHNAKRFDIKKAYAKFVQFGFPPPRPCEVVDTRELAKKVFGFTTNKLDDLGERLGLGRKVQTGGFDLWEACERGEKKAWRLMEKYNKQDVRLLEAVYKKLRAYLPGPHLGRLMEKPDGCPGCGGSNLKADGHRYTRAGAFQRYECKDCGKQCQSRVADPKIPRPRFVG